MNPCNPARALPLAAAAGLLLAHAGCAASRMAPLQREAIRLYDEGQYPEARELLEQIDQKGRASGTLLYRLHYCQQAEGDPGAAATLDRARAELVEELPDAVGLEVPFYLVNTYQNLQLREESLGVATATTARIEAGEIDEPREPLDMFRLGKLYADLGRSDEATRWYTSAMESFPEGVQAFAPYTLWASRYLAEPAFLRGDHAAAERYYGRVAAAGQATAVDLDRLATANYRLGHYAAAETAWERAAVLDPEDADRERYSSKLAALAADLGVLPPSAPDGRLWGALGKDELQAFMVEQAARAQQALAEARAPEPEKPTPERLAELEATIADAQPLFVAAALEFAVQRYGIQETAFFGGFAKMIFHKHEWRVRNIPRKKKS